ncbi:hypothetical protein [Desulfovibrio gilichinskyi]|uniref:Glycogen recognition site of AMP-activated protein kinase n=1 Tax=Desulfovibrio gilichinskyi TaxID=1519643 RepID=A0A1X7CER2_9BACT|nr:hypothetical protein [Desulfovibrio gilichinskyi]SME95199.1 Glycogen recognition site of AMP-activated protein kinase [Desulfovibrio gilichinskyi]
MTDKNEMLNAEDLKLAAELKQMEVRKVPHAFSRSVMDSVHEANKPLWKIVVCWLNSPFNLRLTPLRMALGTALIVMIFFLVPKTDTGHMVEDHSVPVRFEFASHSGSIKHVAVMGSFNSWSAESSRMRYDKERGVWVYETRLPPGDHEYVFLVNGVEVVPDPHADFSRKDGFGSVNSIKFVRSSEYEI